MKNRATVEDTGLGTAFAEGVNEGLRLTGYVLVICKVGDKEKIRGEIKASQVPDVVGDFIAGLRGEHYEIGISIRVIAATDIKSEPGKAQARVVGPTEIGESGIEDAEVVDG